MRDILLQTTQVLTVPALAPTGLLFHRKGYGCRRSLLGASLTLAHAARRIQSGRLNLYVGIIGVILVILLAAILF